MQSLPVYEIVRAVERDFEREQAMKAQLRAAKGVQPRAHKIPRNPITAITAAVEWWFRPGEAPQS